jgi:hypothetical protein
MFVKGDKFAWSEFGRYRRFREAKVTTTDGRDQSITFTNFAKGRALAHLQVTTALAKSPLV